MTVAFATCDLEELGMVDIDLPHHRRAFAAAGIELTQHDWRDRSIDWSAPELVVIRSPWDYPSHLDELRSWLDRLECAAALHNPAEAIRWNLDKTYLHDLSDLGVPVVPTSFCTGPDDLEATLSSHDESEVVVKPSISAGSRDTGRFRADAPGAAALGRAILATGRRVMVQPNVASVAAEGEVAAVCFDGEISHWIRKGPMLAEGGGLLQGPEDVSHEPCEPSAAHLDLVGRATDAVAEHLGLDEPLLYARYDCVWFDGRPALLEAELFEPCFFLPVEPAAADRFAEAVARRLVR